MPVHAHASAAQLGGRKGSQSQASACARHTPHTVRTQRRTGKEIRASKADADIVRCEPRRPVARLGRNNWFTRRGEPSFLSGRALRPAGPCAPVYGWHARQRTTERATRRPPRGAGKRQKRHAAGSGGRRRQGAPGRAAARTRAGRAGGVVNLWHQTKRHLQRGEGVRGSAPGAVVPRVGKSKGLCCGPDFSPIPPLCSPPLWQAVLLHF